MDPDKTIFEEVADAQDVLAISGTEVNSRAYIAKFNFSGEDQKKKVSELSGGERNRVHLAKMLRSEGNVLLLDEPTNDLDVNTLRALEDALIDYPGCAVVISHDRYFLDRIATHILAFEGESTAVWFDGNFSDYEEDKKKRLGEQALVPHRVSYKKLKRD
jgi:ATPase subunit of ABC transporter with duplicated ATPase domains